MIHIEYAYWHFSRDFDDEEEDMTNPFANPKAKKDDS